MPLNAIQEKIRESICEGCLTYNHKSCSYKPMYKGTVCPCSICLIKMICENGCKELNDYIDSWYYKK